ncbi:MULTISPECIES: hypothetical protein [unclassified Streptomyces]|uniref:hypothetical protein n=1 Tax=unclassified Streptomyces TaxID=2593676 RepID=UPI00225506F2|nr:MULTISPECIES: hypothetical protein [unclassified Streptomyces]MCX4834256.1 hypothetical protein [Streptomyces sp. NBC_01016]
MRAVRRLSPLEEVEAVFQRLSCEPLPLVLPAALFAGASAGGMWPLAAVRSRLVHPSCTESVRARVWAEVLRRRARQGAPWDTVAVAFALPGLRRAVGRLPRLAELEVCEVEQEALAAVALELVGLSGREAQVGLRLVRAGDRAAHRLLYAAQRSRRAPVVSLEENTVGAPLYGTGGMAEVIAVVERAVAAGVLSELEGELVTQTRLEKRPMAKAASAVGVSVRSAFRHRAAAEERLAAALRTQGD